ncbi:hypothetical protein [Roseomonas gilardii]|uniref:hypothetical protein n=1 Tax=Roseomonas gilardii TaxID=257708 RepID=UPI000A94CFE0|nr:hypothetical protein [Roseomonas gilardii]
MVLRVIIFQDEHLQVIRRVGATPYTLFTFNDRVTLADGENIFAGMAIKKARIDAIGFMARKANWFPRASIQAALPAVEEVLQGDRPRVGYGGSMGGYAAIKYSRAFQLNTVISLCPQWSIEPSSVSHFDKRYEKYYFNDLCGMEIGRGDIQGNIYLLFDPYYKVDALHAALIEKACGHINFVPVPSADHHVTKILAGTKTLKNIISLCGDNLTDDLIRYLSPIRRNHPQRAENLILRAAFKHPSTALRLLNAKCEHFAARPSAKIAIQAFIGWGFIRQGQYNLAESIFQDALTADPRNLRSVLGMCELSTRQKNNVGLRYWLDLARDISPFDQKVMEISRRVLVG